MANVDPRMQKVGALQGPLAELQQIAALVDKVTFELADKIPSETVAQLVVVAGEVECVIKDVRSRAHL